MQLLVLGIGNVLMGDEAVGVHVACGLEAPSLPPGVTVIDGGTGGFHLLSCLTDYDPVIVVDATMDGKRPGTVTVTKPRYASDFPRTLTAHDIGLRDLVESAALLKGLPEMFLVTISIDAIQPMETRLTPTAASAVPAAIERVRQLLSERATSKAGDLAAASQSPCASGT